jgi:hypothetical protein
MTHQSTSTPSFRRSAFARSISPISSLCASGTSLKAKTPQPRRKSMYAPKETRAQKGSCLCRQSVSGSTLGRWMITYHGDDLCLDHRGEGNQLEVERKVELAGC